ncbi:MAG TPA: hypothetical protein VGR53_11570 [Nitrososphaerales archaeon]|nr:hypothetical protein [Nitrososphaerales archaeon]
MRPILGVSVEVAILAGIAAGSSFVPPGLFFAIYVLVAQGAGTYLVHCPAHYIVGRALGINFRSIRFGRTTLARALPPRFSGLARLVPILTLSTERASLAKASKGRAAAMYASGTIASVCSAFVIAGLATVSEASFPGAIAWLLAIGYLLFDVVFSPRTGDISRARAALGA